MENQETVLANILDITFSDMGFIVFLKPLKWKEEKDLAVPIFIGIPEAQSIAIQFNKIRSPRPLIMDLFYQILSLLQVKVSKVEISDLIDKTFYAKVYLEDKDGNHFKVDARSSDALVMALRFNAQIYIKKYIVEDAGILIKKETVSDVKETVKATGTARTRLQILEEELKKAIEEERYEDAARLRDEVKSLKGESN